MPAQLSGPTQDAWYNAGAKYFRSGATRGTTTGTGVFVVKTGFPRLLKNALGELMAAAALLAATLKLENGALLEKLATLTRAESRVA